MRYEKAVWGVVMMIGHFCFRRRQGLGRYPTEEDAWAGLAPGHWGGQGKGNGGMWKALTACWHDAFGKMSFRRVTGDNEKILVVG